MKNLELISFVGIDENTNLEELWNLNCPVTCEFSVLFSDERSVKKFVRYPSYDFCKKFLQNKNVTDKKLSIHLCGSSVERYLSQDKDMIELCEFANRIQLNFNINNYQDYELLSKRILDVTNLYNHTVILQKNASKNKFLEHFLNKKPNNCNLLYDSSGGFGRVISTVEAPLKEYFTGYAGGLNPENVKSIVDLIENSNVNNNKYYIDMESGIRENNIFCLKKCAEVIKNIYDK